ALSGRYQPKTRPQGWESRYQQQRRDFTAPAECFVSRWVTTSRADSQRMHHVEQIELLRKKMPSHCTESSTL
ncbi:MAG TPA: hypothetical protein VJ860_02885, partial [Polyangia bacterium]|nr:hypothetical protein [Polyangia bacterium]